MSIRRQCVRGVYRALGALGIVLLIVRIAPGPSLSASVAEWDYRGISYVAYWRDLYSSAQSDQSLARLAATGANSVSILVTCYQETVTSTEILCLTDSRTPTDDDLRHVIDRAHQLGLKVMLKPHIDINIDPTRWRGEINFGSDEAAWAQWFASYQNFIVHYAQLAQEAGVEVFVIGTELKGTSHRESNWRSIIAAVRSVYSGLLTYAANFDGDQFVINFWDALDFIGVNAYYPLTQTTNPTLAQLKAAWGPHKADLAAFSQAKGLPIVFTEVGYRSVDGTNMAPWEWINDGPLDLQEQADCYRALFEVFQSEPWMEGVFWWSWETDPNHGGPTDKSYSPHNKPAEEVLRYFFGAPVNNTPALFRVERATGNVYTDGAFLGGGADLAEYVSVSEPVEPGDVVEVDPHNPKSYRKARGPYSPLVAGVISTGPGMVLNARGGDGDRALLALLGRVPVKATTENGPIRPGDLLTSASKPGYAMRCASPKLCEGALLGKALEALEEGSGLIVMLITR